MAGNFPWSGYLAASANVLTTELNSLADGNVCALGSEQDNSSAKSMFADFQLDLASLSISSTSAFLSLFIIPTVDGTNYPDFSSGAVGTYHAQYYVGTIVVKNVTSTTARADVSYIQVPPGKFKVALRNGVGASLASSGNTLAIRYYDAAYT